MLYLGDNRFRPTNQTVDPWDGVYSADSYSLVCPKDESLSGQSEDCLYLNVFLPYDKQNSSKAVMIWIHSDMNAGDGGAKYNGSRLAALGNVIVVTFNYR